MLLNDGVTKVLPAPKAAPTPAATYHSTVPVAQVADNETVPVPQRLPFVTVGAGAAALIVAVAKVGAFQQPFKIQ